MNNYQGKKGAPRTSKWQNPPGQLGGGGRTPVCNRLVLTTGIACSWCCKKGSRQKEWTGPGEPSGLCEENMVFSSRKRDKIQRISCQNSSERNVNFPPFTLPLVVLRIFSRVFAVRVVRKKTIEEVEIHVKRFDADGVWPSQVHKFFGRGLNGLHQGTQKVGVFSRFVLFGVRKCKPLN